MQYPKTEAVNAGISSTVKDPEGATPSNSSFQIHRRLFSIAWHTRGFFPFLAGSGFLGACVAVAQMYFLSLIISQVFIHSVAPKGYLLGMLFLAIVLRAFLIWSRERYAQKRAVTIKSDLRMNMFRSLLHGNMAQARSIKTGELVNNLSDGIEKLDDYFTRYIPAVVQVLVFPAVIALYVLFNDWLSGLIMLVTAPLILFFMWLIGTMAKNVTRRQWQKMNTMSAHFLDALQGMKTLKIFHSGERESARVIEVSNRFRVITMEVLKVAFLSGMVLELAASVSIAMVALQVGIRLIEGLMGYHTGLFVLLLAPEFYLPFRALGQHHHTGMEAAAAAEKIFDIPAPEKREELDNTPEFVISAPIQINFDRVSFSYPGSSLPAVDQVECLLEAGQLTAVVGATGSGKTTFSHLLMGYIQPVSGTVRFNGIPLEGLQQTGIARLIAWVPQHPHFFNATVFDNLKMANPKAGIYEIEAACQLAYAHDFILALPGGYHTRLTENASRLSGGEKQRLAIARAFLKNAPVVVLDEPTSDLDPESEELIALATEKLLKNRTSLIIAHRLKTIFRADKILVFRDGKIAESGTHRSLASANGIYAGYLQTMTDNNEGP